MKLSELKTRKLSEETKGKWKIGNLKGVYKNFKTNDSPEALAWMRNRSTQDEADAGLVFKSGGWLEDPKVGEREDKQREKEEKQRVKDEKEETKKKDLLLKQLYDDAMDGIASSFPDGDPIDHISTFMRRNNLYGDDLDLAFKKYGHGYEKKGFYPTVAQMWDDHSSDQLYDANLDLKAGRKPENSQFYDVEDGKAVLKKNPWK